MKFKKLLTIFLIILLLGLVLYSFLGGKFIREPFSGTFDIELNKPNQTNQTNQTNNAGSSPSNANASSKKSRAGANSNYDNYNHYSGSSSQLTNGMTFYGQNGGSVQVSMQSNGQPMLNVTMAQGQQPVTFTTTPNSGSVSSSDSVMNPFSSIFGNSNNANTSTSEGYTNFNSSKSSSTNMEFYGPNGETALVINHNGERAVQVNTNKGSYIYTTSAPSSSSSQTSSPYNQNYTTYNNTPLTYYGSTGVKGSDTDNSNAAYSGGSSSMTSSAPSMSAASPSSSSSSYDYSNSLPQGIPRSQIPPGQEDLYILKSEIVPPVCPACPVAAACPREEKCPPCPACARCPEPAFECKKVPNYNSVNNEFLPVPVVNDFSTFGM